MPYNGQILEVIIVIILVARCSLIPVLNKVAHNRTGYHSVFSTADHACNCYVKVTTVR